MGPFHKLTSFFSASVIDINNNKMGVRGKTGKFPSDMDIFATERIKTKTYVWATLKIPKKKKGNYSKCFSSKKCKF